MKKLLSLLVAAPIVLATSVASANSCYTVRGGAITDYSASCGSSVSIPSTINGEEVWGIAPKAFANKGISSVTLPSSITDIGEFAFYGNNLTSVSIPNGALYVGPQAFAFNSISSATIPSTVDSIGEGAFEGNCISSNARLDALSAGWKQEQYGCGNSVAPVVQPTNPQPTQPTPVTPIVQPTQPSTPVVGQILFPNFTVKSAPAVTNLDDVLLNGMKDRFGYDNTKLTRGEFLRIVMDSANVDLNSADLSELDKYRDVNANNKYARYVAYASANKIVSGYDNGTFQPNKSITRDEATKILVQSIGVRLASAQTTFADITPENTLGIYVQTAFDNKLVNGVNTRDGRLTYGNRALFAPKNTITKWELYKIVYNIMN